MKKITLLFSLSLLIFVGCRTNKMTISVGDETEEIAAAIDTTAIEPNTGFVMAPNYELVIAQCTGCHSSKLVLQYRGDRLDWLNKIRWMQEKQNLWDLGETEPLILDYLARNYPAVERSDRRKPLENGDWYELKNGGK